MHSGMHSWNGGNTDRSARKDRWQVTDKRLSYFAGSTAEDFLIGLAARVEKGERAPAFLVLEAVRLFIAYGIQNYDEIVHYGAELGFDVTGMDQRKADLERLDTVIHGLLVDSVIAGLDRDRSVPTESGLPLRGRDDMRGP